MTGTADLLSDLSRRGIELAAHGNRLRYRPRSAVTPDLAERLRIHKGALLAILGQSEGRDGATGAPVGPGKRAASSGPALWQDCIEPRPACPCCGGLVSWWSLLGDRRCMACDPPATAMRLLERAERIRRRRGIPSPIGAAEMLADLKRLTGKE